MASGKVPQPGLPERLRILALEEAIRVLLKYVRPDSEAARLAIDNARKLLDHE